MITSGDDSRAKLIYEKQDLLSPLQSAWVAAPPPRVSGTTETDYYSGAVTHAARISCARRGSTR